MIQLYNIQFYLYSKHSYLMIIHSIQEEIQRVHVVKRPSAVIKTPYVADVVKWVDEMEDRGGEDDNGKMLAHTPSLGCCGLCEAGCNVYMAMRGPGAKSAKTAGKVVFASLNHESRDRIVCIDPKLSEVVARECIMRGLVQHLCVQDGTVKAEVSVGGNEGEWKSRFDFAGEDDNGVPFVLEVKSVPLADYEDVTGKVRKRRSKLLGGKYYDIVYAGGGSTGGGSRISYFPDGYRKSRKLDDPVSPRALKHVQHLCALKREKGCSIRCVLLFVIPRTDVRGFQPSALDPLYRSAVQEAWRAGVEIRTVVVRWTPDGLCHFVRNDLPIHLFMTYGPWNCL